MRRELLALGILSVFLTAILMPVSQAFYVYNPPVPGCPPNFSPVIVENDAGYAYNISRITYITTILNLSGTFSYNFSQGGLQAVGYYIALGKLVYTQQHGYTAYYLQPLIIIAMNGNQWWVYWFVQAWGNDGGNPHIEYNKYGLITSGYGSSVTLGLVLNLTMKVTLNSQGVITGAWVYIATQYGFVYFSQSIPSQNLTYPIPDSQVFFEVEDVLYAGAVANFPIIPSNQYVFTDAFASNISNTYAGPPLCLNGVEFVMKYPYAWAYVTPTYTYGSQGVQYIW